MPKYWGKQIFSLGRFPEVGQRQKTEKREREKDRKLVIRIAKLRMAHAARMGHASCLGQKQIPIGNSFTFAEIQTF